MNSFHSPSSCSSPRLSKDAAAGSRTRTLCLVLMVGALVLHGAEKFSLPSETTGFKPGLGAEIAIAQCLLCHSADYVSTQPRLARPAWKTTVLKMRDKYGAPLPEDRLEALVDYLANTYGSAPPATDKAR